MGTISNRQHNINPKYTQTVNDYAAIIFIWDIYLHVQASGMGGHTFTFYCSR